MKKTKGCIYYTDNRLNEPMKSLVQKHIKASGLPIVSTSLKPIDFGKNIVLENRERSYPTMALQIYTALENLDTDYVFFCEHDVLYPKSHFEFTPKEDNVFYYNANVWRWWISGDKAIRYDGMLPLSCLCVNRKFALEHYKMRMDKIKEWKLDEIRSREPRWARLWGYEPGRKKKRRGGFTDDESDTWYSEDPVIDIRHDNTFSRLKCTQADFKNQPTGWTEINIKELKWIYQSLSRLATNSSLRGR